MTEKLTAFTVAFLVGLSVFLGAGQVAAHNSHGWVWAGNDRIMNFDHKSQSATSANKDWPVHIMFWGNATVNTIKANRQDVFPYNCNIWDLCDQYFYFDQTDEDGGWKWDSDGGRKQFRCGPNGGQADAWALHYRAYDDNGLPIYWDPVYLFYVPVTTHYDYDDPGLPWPSACDNKQHGYDEEAEWNMYFAYTALGWPGWQNAYHWHNSIGYRLLGGVPHHGTGTGSPSEIQVP